MHFVNLLTVINSSSAYVALCSNSLEVTAGGTN